jgi:hypothetical protein
MGTVKTIKSSNPTKKLPELPHPKPVPPPPKEQKLENVPGTKDIIEAVVNPTLRSFNTQLSPSHLVGILNAFKSVEEVFY